MNVSSILTSLNTQISDTLGNTWSELDYVYDLEKNKKDRIDLRYGVGASSGDTVSGVTKAATFDFNFFCVLSKCINNKLSDQNQRTTLSAIYDQYENIVVNVFQKKLNNSNILLVSGISYDDPEVIHEAITVRMNFVIKFRNRTT